MYTLNDHENNVLSEYYSLIEENSRKTREYQIKAEQLFRRYAIEEYEYKNPQDKISNILTYGFGRDPRFYVSIEENAYGKPSYIWTPQFNKIKKIFDRVNDIRSEDIHEETVKEEAEIDYVKKNVKFIIKFYFEKIRVSKRDELSTNNLKANKALDYIFSIYREVLVERPIFYVILLIDCSGSMGSIRDVKNTMASAHKKALDALRGSADCNKRSMWVFQYLFNQESIIINQPEILSPFGDDKVKLINSSNYFPEGVTALYQTIEESLKKIKENYILPAKIDKKRIDKVSIGVITDGEDNYINGVFQDNNPSLYSQKKGIIIKSIKSVIGELRGNGNETEIHLESSVLIGLTSEDFSKIKLEEIRKELGFNSALAIDNEDEKALRIAFQTHSTNALNI